MRLKRTCPDLPADLLSEPEEWQAANLLNRRKVPKTPPGRLRCKESGQR
jgi:hypothetical protein